MFIFERANKADYDSVINLFRMRQEWLKQERIDQWQEELRPFDSQVSRNIEAGYTWVIREENGEAIGTISASTQRDIDFWDPNSAPTYYIYKMVTDPRWKGQGIGSEMISGISEHAKNMGVRILRWDANRGNEKLRRYYRSVGARFIGTKNVEGRFSGDMFEKSSIDFNNPKSPKNIEIIDRDTEKSNIDSSYHVEPVGHWESPQGMGDTISSSHKHNVVGMRKINMSNIANDISIPCFGGFQSTLHYDQAWKCGYDPVEIPKYLYDYLRPGHAYTLTHNRDGERCHIELAGYRGATAREHGMISETNL